MPRPIRPAPRHAMGGRAFTATSLETLAQQPLQGVAIQVSQSQACQCASGLQKIFVADHATDVAKRPRQWGWYRRQFANRNDKGKTDSYVFQHVPVLREHDAFAPVARVGESIVRTAAIHPFLARLGIMVGEWEVRRAVTERFSHGNAFGIEPVGDAADSGLRPFFMNIPTLKMLDRPGIHRDQWRMNDGSRIHQSTG